MRRILCFFCVFLFLVSLFFLPFFLRFEVADAFSATLRSCPSHASFSLYIEVPRALYEQVCRVGQALPDAVPPFLSAPFVAVGDAVCELASLLFSTVTSELSGCAMQ